MLDGHLLRKLPVLRLDVQQVNAGWNGTQVELHLVAGCTELATLYFLSLYGQDANLRLTVKALVHQDIQQSGRWVREDLQALLVDDLLGRNRSCRVDLDVELSDTYKPPVLSSITK